MTYGNKLCIFILIILFILTATGSDINRERRSLRFLRKTGPFSEHGKLCNALWRPHFIEPLKECDLDRNKCTEKGYSCLKGYCCPMPEIVCALKADSGHELQPDEHFGRYAFNSKLNSCIKFSYFGNVGNYNNFLTHSDCVHYCHNFCNTSATATK